MSMITILPLKTDDDPCMSPALEYDYCFCFVALLSSGLRGFKRHISYIIIIISNLLKCISWCFFYQSRSMIAILPSMYLTL